MPEQLSLAGMDMPQPPHPGHPATDPGQHTHTVQPAPDPSRVVADASLPGDAPWCHPQANRQVVLQGHDVRYVFRRGQRRTIGFVVHASGLTVSAPRWVTLGAVDEALQAKAAWVVRKLSQVASQHQVLNASRLNWEDGLQLAWLDTQWVVRLGAPAARRGQPLVHPLEGELWVALPATAAPERVRDAVQAWMMRAAHAHFETRLNHFAALLGVRWTSLRLSGATTRWGSAKSDGSIRLHWRLMQFSPGVVDYVVAHELAHLRHMDHSDRFWQTVASVVPDYAVWRSRLKGERLPPW